MSGRIVNTLDSYNCKMGVIHTFLVDIFKEKNLVERYIQTYKREKICHHVIKAKFLAGIINRGRHLRRYSFLI